MGNISVCLFQTSHQWKQDQIDLTQQNVEAQISAMNAATARVVTLTSTETDTDYAAVGSAVATISSNIGEFSRDMRMLAALQEEESDGERLLDAARRLAGAFTDLLRAANPAESNEVDARNILLLLLFLFIYYYVNCSMLTNI